ncbi:MAG: ATP synthase F1 subunit delta [Deltaproteobacteria bacterium]|jgi:F-type H+-transporting ATPase subunit delta|nr:ATP synthase F1 subunit delta [Deltaproteobacteria bacterium]
MDSILAKRYAKALLELGLDDGKFKTYGEELKTFAEGLADSGPAGKILFSPAIQVDKRKECLQKILSGCQLSPMVVNFIELLNERGRFNLLKATAKAYSDLVDEHDGVVRGVIHTATELDDSQMNAIRSALSIYTGKNVELVQQANPDIIGGVIARLGDLEVDGSVRTQLNKLAATFQND